MAIAHRPRTDVPVYRIERINAPDIRAQTAIAAVGLRKGDVITADDRRIVALKLRLKQHGVTAPVFATKGRQQGWIVLTIPC